MCSRRENIRVSWRKSPFSLFAERDIIRLKRCGKSSEVSLVFVNQPVINPLGCMPLFPLCLFIFCQAPCVEYPPLNGIQAWGNSTSAMDPSRTSFPIFLSRYTRTVFFCHVRFPWILGDLLPSSKYKVFSEIMLLSHC